MLSIKFLGGAKKSFGTDSMQLSLDGITIGTLLDHLVSVKPKDTIEIDTKNILVAVNGVDSSALDGLKTVLHQGDTITIIPIIHGGSGRNRFVIFKRNAELFHLRNTAEKNYDYLDMLRKKFPRLVLEGISSRHLLGTKHAKKIVGISLFAQKHHSLLSKKLETDILLRFGATTQISDAIRNVGIDGRDFTIIAIGPKPSLEKMFRFLKPSLVALGDNSKFVQKQYKITKTHLNSVDSDTPLEDILAEKAAVLV